MSNTSLPSISSSIPVSTKIVVDGLTIIIELTDRKISAFIEKPNLRFFGYIEPDTYLLNAVYAAISTNTAHVAVNEETFKSLHLAITYADFVGAFQSYNVELLTNDTAYDPATLLLSLFDSTNNSKYFTKLRAMHQDLKKEHVQLIKYRDYWQEKYEQERTNSLDLEFRIESLLTSIKELDLANSKALKHSNGFSNENFYLKEELVKVQNHRNQLRKQNRALQKEVLLLQKKTAD